VDVFRNAQTTTSRLVVSPTSPGIWLVPVTHRTRRRLATATVTVTRNCSDSHSHCHSHCHSHSNTAAVTTGRVAECAAMSESRQLDIQPQRQPQTDQHPRSCCSDNAVSQLPLERTGRREEAPTKREAQGKAQLTACTCACGEYHVQWYLGGKKPNLEQLRPYICITIVYVRSCMVPWSCLIKLDKLPTPP